jgi:hypothetical protein
MDLLEKASQGYEFAEYLNILNAKLKEDKEKDKLLDYIYLNVRRMHRIMKQYQPADYLAKLIREINQPVTWLAITEGWCGDAAHTLPVLSKLSKLSFKPHLQIVFRDENPALMERFLTNGSKSIPKIIAINNSGEVITEWGPRPNKAQEIVESYKKGESIYKNYDELANALQHWYHRDRYLSIEEELIEFIEPQIIAQQYKNAIGF